MCSSAVFASFLLISLSLVAADAPPPRPRPLPVISPDVQPDRRVTFRLQAPQATAVVLSGQWPEGRAPLVMDASGVWSVTVGPVDAGVWEYSFQVDGLSMIDPGNPAIKPMRQPRTSILHLPGQPPSLHDFQNVPHGVLHQHTYGSKALGRPRELVVYTPPGYDRTPEQRYPTLYLQHGMGDNQATWTVHGKAHWILDNLIAQGRAQPMVVVMLDGHASIGGPAAFGNNSTAFERDLLEDAMPLVEANYRVVAAAGSRAIVGLSMGGEQALRIGLNHPERFAWIGGFSAATPSRESVAEALDHPDATKAKLKLLWIACGKEDFLLKRNEEFIAHLREQQLRHEWLLTEGNHSWPIWRGYLAQLVPRLFQP